IAICETLEEKCQDIGLAQDQVAQRQAQIDWDRTQKVAAEELAVKLPKQPALIRSQLEETPQGAALLINRLTALLAILDAAPFTPPQHSYALDLLGVPTEVRQAGQTVLDPKPGQDPRAAARGALESALAELQAPAAVAARIELDQVRH